MAMILRAFGRTDLPELPVNIEMAAEGIAALVHHQEYFQLTAPPYKGTRKFLAGQWRQAAEWIAANPGDTASYLMLNPVTCQVGDANNKHVISREWLLIDCDSRRPDMHQSATEEEKNAAHAYTLELVSWLVNFYGFPEPYWIDSGNGYHLLFRIDLPNDPKSRTLCGDVLKAIKLKFPEVDSDTFKSTQNTKIPGTWSRKGESTDERPHRMCELYLQPAEIVVVTKEQLQRVAEPVASNKAKSNGKHTGPKLSRFTLIATDYEEGVHPYAAAVLQRELAILAGTTEHRNDQAYKSSAAVGNYVVSGNLDPEDCSSRLVGAALVTGLPEGECRSSVRRGLAEGMSKPKEIPDNTTTTIVDDDAPLPDISILDIATTDDLIKAGAEVKWFWPNWIQLGVVNAIAAPGGTGKTRFCADLVRRIKHGLTWPDGQPIALPTDSTALWVVSDNHHDEMVTLVREFQINDAVYYNAPKADPYSGVSLDCPDDLRALEARVKALRPALVIVDTVGNSTSINLSRQEDAMKYYFPLQVIARKYRCAILALTHLSANGSFLGRRVMEKVRVAIRMDKPDPSTEKRRLKVEKSNSKTPDALGVTMVDGGNEYDNAPPRAADESMEGNKVEPKVQEAMDWLTTWLKDGSQRVSITRNAAETAGIGTRQLYAAKKNLKLTEFESESYKWWKLTTEEEC